MNMVISSNRSLPNNSATPPIRHSTLSYNSQLNTANIIGSGSIFNKPMLNRIQGLKSCSSCGGRN